MTREQYNTLAVTDLREIAKTRGIKGTSKMVKAQLIDEMLALDEKENAAKTEAAAPQAAPAQNVVAPAQTKDNKDNKDNKDSKDKEAADKNTEKSPEEIKALDSGVTVNGILEVMGDGFGFIRVDDYVPGNNDIYVAPNLVKKHNLKTGDIIVGNTKIKTSAEKFAALLYITTVNGIPIDMWSRKHNFEDLTPIFPNEKIKLETKGGAVSMRIMDILSFLSFSERVGS